MRGQILIEQRTVLKLPQEMISQAHLSVPGWSYLVGTNGLCRDTKRALYDPRAPRDSKGNLILPYRSYDSKKCLKTYSFHLESLGLKNADPWILLGVRNLGNNLRIVAFNLYKNPQILQLRGENLQSDRMYYCLTYNFEKRLNIEKVSFLNVENYEWIVSGPPLVWDGKAVSIEEIIPYEYDLRHIWKISNETEIFDLWCELSEEEPEVIATKIQEFAFKKKYPRENSYLHTAIGISKDREYLIWLMAQGAFEDISRMLLQVGAWRAISLDQGGSCCLMRGGSFDFIPGKTISASHYFRPLALSLLIFELKKMEIVGSKIF